MIECLQIQLEDESADGDVYLSADRTVMMNKEITPKVELEVTSNRFSVGLTLSLDEARELGEWLQASTSKGTEDER